MNQGRRKQDFLSAYVAMIAASIALLCAMIWQAWKVHKRDGVERGRLFAALSLLVPVCVIARFCFLDSVAGALGTTAKRAVWDLAVLPLVLLPYLVLRLPGAFLSMRADNREEFQRWATAGLFILYFALPFGILHKTTLNPGLSPKEKIVRVYSKAGHGVHKFVRTVFLDLNVRRAWRARYAPMPVFYLVMVPLWSLAWLFFWAWAFRDRSLWFESEPPQATTVEEIKELKTLEPRVPIALARRGPKVTVEELNRHSLAVGTTGAGKTSFMNYLASELLRRDFGLLFIDPKSDPGNLEALAKTAKALGRSSDLVALELGHPRISAPYNPLMRGNPSVLTDKIMSSTSWTEAYYEKRAREALLLVFSSLERLDAAATFQDLYAIMTQPALMRALADQVPDPFLKRSLLGLSSQLKDMAGLTSYLLNLDISFPQTRTYRPALDLMEAYENQKIVYIGLSVNAFRDTAKIFGKLLFSDLQAATAMIQQAKSRIKPFGVFIDEAGSVLTQGAIDWLNKCRSAGFLSVLGIQSLADLDSVSATFKTQVLANINNLVVFRPNDHEGTEALAKTFGTYETQKRTDAYEPGLIFSDTRIGYSLRDVNEFHIAPDTIKELPNGRAAVLIRGRKMIRGVWDMNRIYAGNAGFENCMPESPCIAIQKRGFSELEFLENERPEPEKSLAVSTANGDAPLPPKPIWED